MTKLFNIKPFTTMKRYRKYVFTEAHRVHSCIKKHGYPSNFNEHLKKSWKTAKILFDKNITPYTGYND